MPTETSDLPQSRPTTAPVWMPAGGVVALWFWGGLALVLAVALIGLYRNFAVEERSARLLRDDQTRLVAENEKLRSEVDRLQTEVSQTGTLLRNREQILRETTESLQAVKAQSDQEGQVAESAKKARDNLQSALEKSLTPPPADPSFKVWPEGDHVIIRLGGAFLFDGTDGVPGDKGIAAIRKVAAALKSHPGGEEIVVSAYLDQVPPPAAGAKAAATNPWELTARRAAMVVRLLVENGVPPTQLVPQGFGDSRPIVGNDTPDKIKNRRVEIVIRPSAADTAKP